jgi:hypothetical protein
MEQKGEGRDVEYTTQLSQLCNDRLDRRTAQPAKGKKKEGGLRAIPPSKKKRPQRRDTPKKTDEGKVVKKHYGGGGESRASPLRTPRATPDEPNTSKTVTIMIIIKSK